MKSWKNAVKIFGEWQVTDVFLTVSRELTDFEFLNETVVWYEEMIPTAARRSDIRARFSLISIDGARDRIRDLRV